MENKWTMKQNLPFNLNENMISLYNSFQVHLFLSNSKYLVTRICSSYKCKTKLIFKK